MSSSRYEKLVKTIILLEALEKIDVTGARQDLQEIARDVRYGGKWDGDFEIVAETLDTCGKVACYRCQYKEAIECKAILKREAAAAIRQLAKDKQDLEERIEQLEERIAIMTEGSPAEDNGSEDPGRPMAAWQKEIMGNLDNDRLPF